MLGLIMRNCGFNFETTYTSLPGLFYTKLGVDTATAPKVILINHALGKSIGLNLSILTEKNLAELFSGKQLPEGAATFSQAYAGHQFGHFAMLGDGRAHLLGEQDLPPAQASSTLTAQRPTAKIQHSSSDT